MKTKNRELVAISIRIDLKDKIKNKCPDGMKLYKFFDVIFEAYEKSIQNKKK